MSWKHNKFAYAETRALADARKRSSVIVHATHWRDVRLLRPSSMSSLSSVKKLLHSRNDVGRELEIFCGLLPLLHADWRAPISYTVNASDASEEASGIGHFDLGQQRSASNVSHAKKMRFNVSTRCQHTLTHWVSLVRLGCMWSVTQWRWRFQTTTRIAIAWTVHCSARWQDPVDISVLEARALNQAIQRARGAAASMNTTPTTSSCTTTWP